METCYLSPNNNQLIAVKVKETKDAMVDIQIGLITTLQLKELNQNQPTHILLRMALANTKLLMLNLKTQDMLMLLLTVQHNYKLLLPNNLLQFSLKLIKMCSKAMLVVSWILLNAMLNLKLIMPSQLLDTTKKELTTIGL